MKPRWRTCSARRARATFVRRHVITKKGRGFLPAEEHPDRYHAVAPHSLFAEEKSPAARTFSTEFGEAAVRLARSDKRICAVTAAMRDGTGLTAFAAEFPDRFFDVGIAEEHAVTFAAGLSRAGMRPIVALYSTFAQRAFDQMLHDAALQRLPLVLALDRCGIVPGDGVTHQGLFDVGLFTPIPGVSVCAPESFAELSDMLARAVAEDGVTVLRYPRGGETNYDRGVWNSGGRRAVLRGFRRVGRAGSRSSATAASAPRFCARRIRLGGSIASA